MEKSKYNGLFLITLMFLLMGAHAMDMKKTQVEFFMHDIVKAKNATAVKVTDGPPAFGCMYVIDDPLTEGPQHNSRALGRARGMYIWDSLQDLSLLLVFTAVFEQGKHQGSTLSFQGQDIAFLKQTEISVVGGTGHFRSATGHATIETQFLTGPNAVLRFNVTVLH
eukprot:Gb_00421 [translate_table: standard]